MRQAEATLAHVALTLGLLATWSCLVTDKVEFDDAPNSPATVSRVSPSYWTQLRSVGDPQCQEGRPYAFVVDISDLDLDQRLEARLVINGRQVEGATQNIRVSKERTPQRERLVLCAPASQFVSPCNYVELLVTSDFNVEDEPYGTQIPGDLAKQDWIVSGSSDPREADVKFADCASLFSGDGGVP